MLNKKTKKPSLKLVECAPELQMPKPEVDELAMLIRSINEMGKKAKGTIKQQSEPEPPLVA